MHVPQIGRPRRRAEDPRLVSGRGCYVDDLRLPGTLSLAILRSPYPHARIESVDLSAARAAPGVVDVIDGRETAQLSYLSINRVVPELRVPRHPPLAIAKVRYTGDEVAAVLAEDSARACDALDLITVEYKPLPGVADAEAALADDAPILHDELSSNVAFEHSYGDSAATVSAALGAADYVVSLRIQNSRVAPVPIEPRGVLAQFDPTTGVLHVWTSTQRPFMVRADLAALLGLSEERIRVIAPDVGGAFGSKGTLYREEVLAAYLAVKHARPVRWVATRSEDFLTSMHSRDQVNLVRAGFSRDGALLAIHARVLPNLGAYLQINTARPPTRTARLVCGAYRVPVARSEIVAAFTNTAPTGPYRGAGRPEGAFLIERLMDVTADELGLDPIEIRRRNFIRPDEFPWSTPTGLTYDSGSYAHTLDVALEKADYTGLRRRREQARSRGELFGIGVSTFIEPSAGDWESGRIRVEPDGTVVAGSGSSAQGQGHVTTFAQVVSDRLQVPVERVRVVQGDSANAPPGIGTFGSRSAALGGSALAKASDRVLARMRSIAAHLLEVGVEDVSYAAGVFSPVGVPTRGLDFAEVAAAAYEPHQLPSGVEPGLDMTDRFEEPLEVYSHGAHVAAVGIDRETGRVHLHTLVAVDDAGVLINPLLAEGQVMGGLAQGTGQALLEHMIYAEDGTVMTASLGDYAVPKSTSVPTWVLGETVTPTPLNPLGVKGVGEGGAVGAPPAIVNAVMDALAPFGIRHLDMPLSAERVWAALSNASTPRPGESAQRARGSTSPVRA